ncbi:uncharacterized protein L203_106380 [Cryptococcus depauperatus CBS 7841]|uniref:DASH complex subunit ASK1 n=1 Tax=Cryptococcus depauperatus CBS 7841 TaxID=1295531 RepID=A0A1E3IJA4_9TREE|nr:hypothetical protein L203_02617 [Cryptococcus depauperatus CBS 7841]
MSNTPNNLLLKHPFFSIPGIDPSDPISAQTEKLDQLITLLLRDIDANFARFHQIVTNKVLPQIKKYAIASEPTRESAQFWRAFFETASSVRLSNHGDMTTNTEQPDVSTQYDDHTFTLRREDESSIRNDGSFMFDPPPGTSSTPLPAGRSIGKPNDSWEDSIESPFDRLDRKLRDELKIGQDGKYAEQSSSEMPTPSLPSGYSLPGMDSLNNTSNISETAHSYRASLTPKANRLANPPPASANPFGPNFSGIADLRSTPLNMKFKGKAKAVDSRASIMSELSDSGSDSDSDLPPGMSPPVTMAFNLPPRAQAIMSVAQTPAKGKHKEAGGYKREIEAKILIDDLLKEMSQEMSPKLETPEALRRYSVLPNKGRVGKLDSSLSSTVRPPSLDEDKTFRTSISHVSQSQSYSHLNSYSHHSHYEPESFQSQPHVPRKSLANSSFNSNTTITEVPRGPDAYSNEESSDDDDDSFESSGDISSLHIPSTGSSNHPGFAPSYPTALPRYEGEMHHQNIVPDDSYAWSAGDVTDTSLFGGNGGRQPPRGFALMTKDEMHTYNGGKLEDAAGEDLELSPTKMIGMGRLYGGAGSGQ